jgi:NADPH:quinone reductase-like Zn-dependent oxidoreductase
MHMPKTMKVVLLRGYGDVNYLSYDDAPVPEPQKGEVLVKLIAASVNPIDWKMRRGDFKTMRPLEFPAILGRDLAGEVVALGEGVTSPAVGQLVMGLVSRSYAEYVACQAADLAPIPKGLDPVDAAAIPLVALTGAQLIELGVRPRSGETLLITGAIGGVGRTAVHVARQHGAHVIAGVRAGQKPQAIRLGAARVIALEDEKEIADLPELDAVADTVGHDVIEKIIPHIRKNGILATVVGIPASAKGRDLRAEQVWVHPDAKRLEQLAWEVARGEFTIPIGRKMKLSEIRAAQQIAEKGGIGKVVLTA